MHTEELCQIINNVAVVTRGLQNDARQAVETQQQAVARLEHRLAHLDELVKNALQTHADGLRSEAVKQISEGSQEGMRHFSEQLTDLKSHMLDFSTVAGKAKRDLQYASQSVLMRISYLSVAVLLVLAGSVTWLMLHYGKEIEKRKLTAEAMEFYSTADLKRCDERLCVKIKKTPSKFRNEGYMFIEQKK